MFRINKYRGAAALLLALALLGAGGKQATAPGFGSAQSNAGRWLNSQPLSMQALRGKVVLVEFWTFGCWNCRHVEPYIRQWHQRYNDKGLVVVGVHTPEFAYERKPDKLRNYVKENDIRYPVVIDNDSEIWRAFHNWAWPTIYLIGKKGEIRYSRIGEGGYRETERAIRELLGE